MAGWKRPRSRAQAGEAGKETRKAGRKVEATTATETIAPAEVGAAPVVEAAACAATEANRTGGMKTFGSGDGEIFRCRRRARKSDTGAPAPGFAFSAKASDRRSPLLRPRIHCFP